MHPAGGAAPPFGARLTAAALPAPLPGRPLRPRWEAGGRGPSRQPQLQPVFVASSRLPARPRLAAPGFTQRWRVRLLGGLHAPAAARAPRPACTGPRRLQRAAPKTNRPLLLLLLRAPGVGGGEAGEQRQWQRSERQRLGCNLAGLGAEDQQIQLAQGRLGDGEPCTRRGARAPQQRRRAGLSRARVPGRFAGLPGSQPRAAQHPPLASGPALRPAWPARAASSRSRRPGNAVRCSAPARLTGAGARYRRCVSPPARPPRDGPISCSREAVTTVTRRRVLREAGPGSATRAFRGKIQRPAGRLSNLFPLVGTRRGLLLEDYNSRHAASLNRAKESQLEAQGMLVVVVPLLKA